ncbi:hypothetical protein L9F63_005001, partial [Diploptera punctata]
KLWYTPLFFSVWFMFYVLALIIKAISRHKKILFPAGYRTSRPVSERQNEFRHFKTKVHHRHLQSRTKPILSFHPISSCHSKDTNMFTNQERIEIVAARLRGQSYEEVRDRFQSKPSRETSEDRFHPAEVHTGLVKSRPDNQKPAASNSDSFTPQSNQPSASYNPPSVATIDSYMPQSIKPNLSPDSYMKPSKKPDLSPDSYIPPSKKPNLPLDSYMPKPPKPMSGED